MKARAAILIFLLVLLLLQPGLELMQEAGTLPACMLSSMEEECTMNSGCSFPPDDEDDRSCREMPCNPLQGCPKGNFYLNNSTAINFAAVLTPQQTIMPVNDNRVFTNLKECWHPPEV